MVRAKFYVVSKTITDAEGCGSVKLQPVVGDSPENKEWSKWTPSGVIEISTINPRAMELFEVGKAYTVDFTPAD